MLTGTTVRGVDRLFAEHQELIRGRRVAVLTNHSGRLADGTHIADAIAAHPGSRLVALFGMHHDVRTNDYSLPRDPETTIDGPTGAPKVDLYATIHKPTPAMLAETDVVLVDVQDAGARFYEHINVMGFVLEAAADRGIPVVVLDRPNPIAPLAPDGFLPDEDRCYQFGSYGPIPIVHGMTMGELARFYVGEGLLRSERAPELHVIPMLGWSRQLWFDETAPYRPPSPNLIGMPSLIGYPGFGLFEAFEVSEGRGTDHPFEQIGSPWLDADAVAERCMALGLPGVTFLAEASSPTRQPFHGAPPRFADQRIPTVRVVFGERSASTPVRAAIALWWALRAVHADRLAIDPATHLRLMGTDRARSLIDRGASPSDVIEAWGREVARFVDRRAPYLLYE